MTSFGMHEKQDNPAQARAPDGRWYSRAGRSRTGGKNLPAPWCELGRGLRDVFLGITSFSSSCCITPSSKGGPEHKAGATISQKKRMSLIFFLNSALFLQPQGGAQAKLAVCFPSLQPGSFLPHRTSPKLTHPKPKGPSSSIPLPALGLGHSPQGWTALSSVLCSFPLQVTESRGSATQPALCASPAQLSSGHTVAAFIRFIPCWMLSCTGRPAARILPVPGALVLLDFGLEMLQGFGESKVQKVPQPMETWQERAGDPG